MLITTSNQIIGNTGIKYCFVFICENISVIDVNFQANQPGLNSSMRRRLPHHNDHIKGEFPPYSTTSITLTANSNGRFLAALGMTALVKPDVVNRPCGQL